jgi:hypothetical protein
MPRHHHAKVSFARQPGMATWIHPTCSTIKVHPASCGGRNESPKWHKWQWECFRHTKERTGVECILFGVMNRKQMLTVWLQGTTKARFTCQSFPWASSQWHRICGWENPGVLTSYTLVSVLVAMMYVHVVTANPSGSAAAPSCKCECSLPF